VTLAEAVCAAQAAIVARVFGREAGVGGGGVNGVSPRAAFLAIRSITGQVADARRGGAELEACAEAGLAVAEAVVGRLSA
jgi:hypothetical protein